MRKTVSNVERKSYWSSDAELGAGTAEGAGIEALAAVEANRSTGV